MEPRRTPLSYLVTGGAGFIGSNFVRHLVNEHTGVKIAVLDALTYAGNIANICDLVEDGRVDFLHGDINDRQLVDGIMADRDPDIIVNFAAESHVDRSIENPRLFLETNILGTQCLLDSARAAWRDNMGNWQPDKLFIQVGTDEVYGQLPHDFAEAKSVKVDEHTQRLIKGHRTDQPLTYGTGYFTESTPLAPSSPYSASKAAADMLALAYHHTYGMPVCVTRCSNNYGPRQFPEKLIPLMINNIVHGRELPVYGEGLNVRDWLFVDDHCRAITAVARSGKPGRVYNIGGLNEKQNIDIVRQIIELVAELTGTQPRHDLVRHVRDRAGHDARYAIDPSRIASELGWAPTTDFENGIRQTVKWYIDNQAWTDNVTSGNYREYYEKMYANR